MKRLCLISILLFCLCVIGAETKKAQVTKDARDTGMGFQFGTVSGNGFAYRNYWQKSGFQYVLGGMTTGSKDIDYDVYGYYSGASEITKTEKGRKTTISSSLNYLHTLANNDIGRFYIFGGGSVLYSLIREYEVDYRLSSNDHYVRIMDQPERKKWGDKYNYYLGFGLGFDFQVGQNFHWVVELPLTIDEDSEIMMYIPQTGLYYFFR
ncbi:MAG: hypothetical protein ABFC98_07215 [Candidatus Cloacimonas sp.]